MTTTQDGRASPKRRPGPKPRGRTVIPLTITVTPAQRTALEVVADREKSSISMVVRRFIAAGLAAGCFCILTAFIEIASPRRRGAGALRAAKELAWTHRHSRAWQLSRSPRAPNSGASRSRSSI